MLNNYLTSLKNVPKEKTKMTNLIRYPSLYTVACPNCGEKGVEVSRIKTKFGNMNIAAKVDVDSIYDPSWEDEFQEVLKNYGFNSNADVTLKTL